MRNGGSIRRAMTGAALLLGCLCALSTVAFSEAAETQAAPSTIDVPAVIPIFPLDDIMLFPHASRPLHIFEPRYRRMVADALAGDRIIGMVMLRPGYEDEYEGNPPIYEIGTAGVIANVEEFPDGRYNIVLRGVTKFRVTSEDWSRPYRMADVVAIPDPLGYEDEYEGNPPIYEIGTASCCWSYSPSTTRALRRCPMSCPTRRWSTDWPSSSA